MLCSNSILVHFLISVCEDTDRGEGDRFTIQLPERKNAEYLWNDQSIASSREISEAGVYNVEGSYLRCYGSDSIEVSPLDCDPRLIMPNIFTPNGDELNQLFIPKEYNYIKSGTTVILNRWGNEIFSGDLFTGWDGKTKGNDALTVFTTIGFLHRPQGEKARCNRSCYFNALSFILLFPNI